MKKIIGIIIVIVVIGVTAYFIVNNLSKEGKLQAVQMESDAYEKEFDEMLASLNEYSSVIYNENAIYVYGSGDYFRLSSEIPNRETIVELHDMTNSMIEGAYIEIKPYTLTDDIKGIIAKHKEVERFAFIQTNKSEGDYQLLIMKEDIESEDELLSVLEDYEQPEKKSYTKNDLESMMDMTFSDLMVLNIDDEEIKEGSFSFSLGNDYQVLTIHYKFEKDGDTDTGSLAIRPNRQQRTEVTKRLKTEKGLDVVFNDKFTDTYSWKLGDYVYELSLDNIEDLYAEEDILALIDKSNGQFLP